MMTRPLVPDRQDQGQDMAVSRRHAWEDPVNGKTTAQEVVCL